MEAITVQKITVKCDSCDFTEETQLDEVKAWHNKECPNCGAIVIDDEDMSQLDAIIAVKDLVNTVSGDVEDGHSVTFSYDTAKAKQ